ncbi:hypothetical protein A9Q78_04400 [Methylophaga sp. 41_12_T18]|nr:hypothetical protein A9Q78_04400 [Methylophaga sp. 41_12_T18]
MFDIEKLINKKVLIVDDQSDNLKVLYNTLKTVGYDISLAKSGQQALNHIWQHLPDLILLDITLPDINGLEICRKVKASEETENIPIVFISASTDSNDVIKGFEAGCVDYIRKPFVESEVIARVRNHLTLKCLHEELEHQVAERTGELARAKHLAEMANQAKTKFLSRMSHEFKTPLNAVLGFTQLQEQQIIAGEVEKVLAGRDCIMDAGNHLLSLVNDILDVADMENRQLKFSVEKVDLNNVILAAVRGIQQQANKLGIAINYNQTDLTIDADEHHLRQVFSNLLTNAIKFNSPQGLVNIDVKQIEGQQVQISIMDTGVGIDREYKEKIFMPFLRLEYAEKNEIAGAGIGLYQAQYLVNEMKGTLTFESLPKQGSLFFVRLPLNKSE